jgi:hypothetical protein
MAATGYQIAQGWDNLDGLGGMTNTSLKVLRPRVLSVTPGRVQRLLDGSASEDGHFNTALVYAGYLTGARLTWLLELFGLTDRPSAPVTICLPGRTRDWEYWNAWIYKPDSQYGGGRFGETAFPLALVEYLPREFSNEFTGEFA